MSRLFAWPILLLLLAPILGCSQSSAPLPGGPVSGRIPERGTPAAGSRPAMKFFNTPTQSAWPDYIVSGPQGALWFTEFYVDKIGRITTDGHISEFPLPDNNDVEGIAAGADGNIWFTEPGANQIGRMTPSGTVTAFPIKGDNPSPRGITPGPDGNIWYVEYYDSYIGRVTPGGRITRFAIPETESYPWDITTGPDGSLWFTQSATNRIGRFNPRTLKFKSSIVVPTQYSTPWGILLAPDKHVWFTERNGNKIAVVGKNGIREFAIAQPGSYPEKLAAGSDGNLWFTEMQTAGIGRLNPLTGKFKPVIMLPAGSIPIGMATGPDGNIWFAVASYTSLSEIGKAVPR